MEWVSDVVHLAVVGLLFVVMVWQEREHRQERQDLLDRMMSRDIEQYKAVTAPEPVKSDPVDLTEEEEWEREIIAQKER